MDTALPLKNFGEITAVYPLLLLFFFFNINYFNQSLLKLTLMCLEKKKLLDFYFIRVISIENR